MQCIESEYIVYLHVLAHVAVKCKLYRYILSLLFLLSVPHATETNLKKHQRPSASSEDKVVQLYIRATDTLLYERCHLL